METFLLKMVSPEGVIFEQPVYQVTACNTTGWFALRAQHIDFFASLVPCKLEAAITLENRKHFQIESGILEFSHTGSCTIICEGKIAQAESVK